MSELFPWYLPGDTVRYLCLYMVTLAVHVVFMSYVLAGAGQVALGALAGRGRGPVSAVLRDWLPFFLGAAITAGVAPLLFVQVLYQESFYTANLLLFHRFMAIVPVLVVGFYLLYLGKTRAFERWSRRTRAALSVAAFACFAFVGLSWVENHLLALDRGAWVELYASARMHYASAASLPRALFWLAYAVPMTALVLAWQMRSHGASGSPAAPARSLALAAGLGLLASAALVAWYRATGEQPLHGLGAASAPYAYGVLAGALAQSIAWVGVWHGRVLDGRLLWLASLGAGASLLCVIAMRESVRVAGLPMDQLAAVHERAAQAGGMWVFFVCLALTGGVLVAIVRMTAAGLRGSGPSRG